MRLKVALFALLLTGCAAPAARVDTISFDRGQFGYTLGGAAQTIRTACKLEKLSKEDCAVFAEIERNVVKQLTTPPAAPAASSSVDMEAIMKMLMALGKMAM
jgi:hypothetical protein